MQISDALPVQFWLTGCETYNQREVCGIYQRCFCQPWQCDDIIKIEFTEEDPDRDYFLKVVNENGATLEIIALTKEDIFRTQTEFAFDNNSFESSLSGWSQYSPSPGSSAGWNWNDPSSALADGTSGTLAQTYELYQNRPSPGIYTKWPPGTYQFIVRVSNESANGSSPLSESLEVNGYNTLGVFAENATVTIERGGGYTEYTVDLITTQGYNYFAFEFFKQGSSSGSEVKIYIDSIEIAEYPLDYSTTKHSLSFIPSDYNICDQQIILKIIDDSSPEVDIASSDCLDIKTEYECTNLITYSSNRDFAGLIYTDQSPEAEFYLRIPSVFYHERYPEEDRSLPLSNSQIINTSGQIKAQRRLDVFPVPDYFHKKIQLALRHQTVEIDSKQWIREEAYSISEPQNKRYPLKKGLVWLTERNFIVRNVT